MKDQLQSPVYSIPYRLFIVVFAVWLTYGAAMYFSVFNGQLGQQNIGLFSDGFGIINALFSGLAFAGLIVTILLQREELKATREELHLNTEALNSQKEELRAQREEFQKQNQTLSLDRFEMTFFRLVDIQNEITQEFQIGLSSPTDAASWHRKMIIDSTYDNLREAIMVDIRIDYTMRTVEMRGRIQDFIEESDQLHRYFSNLYSIHIHTINAKGITDEQKKFYLGILSRTLSERELALYYYYFSSVLLGRHIEGQVDLFDYLNFDLLADISHEYLYYSNPNEATS